MSTPITSRRRHTAPDQSWLELFYDLAFVAAIVVFSGSLARNYSRPVALWLVLVFAVVWVTWLLNTVLFDGVQVHGSLQRSLVVLQMALVLLIAVTAHSLSYERAYVVGPTTAMILLAFVAIRRLAYRREPQLASEFGTTTPRIAVAALIFAVTGLFESAWFLGFWMVGLALVISTLRFEHPCEPRSRTHLVHRFGEFTLVMLGENFVKLGLVASEEPPDAIDLFAMPLAFVLVASIWWLYFTEIPTSGLPESPTRRRTWVFLHFPLHLAIVALAVGLSKLLLYNDPGAITGRLLLITLPLAVVLLCLAAINLVITGDEARRRARILAAAAAVVVVMAALNGNRNSFAIGALVLNFQLGTTTLAVTAVLLAVIVLIRRAPKAVTESR